MTLKIYLAGPMTGYPEFNFPAFRRAATMLRSFGHEVFNPAETDFGKPSSEVTHREALAVDLAWICERADAAAFLPSWQHSKGAKVERALAEALGLQIMELPMDGYDEMPAEFTRPFPHVAGKPILAPKVTKAALLDKAKAAVGDRGLNYGKPEDNFERIALRWRAHLKNRFGLDVALDATSVALMCADLKLARLEHQPDHLDSWVDLAGYAACGAEIGC